MKKITVLIGVLGFLSTSLAQGNWIPGLTPNTGNVAFGTPSGPSPFHLFQLHGIYDYCVTYSTAELPFEPENTITKCYGQTSHFSMTNPVTGLGQYDGALFRMSQLNLAIENQEDKNIDITTGGALFRLDGSTNKAWFGNTTPWVTADLGAVNIQPAGDNGLYIRTTQSGKYGLSVKTQNTADIAIKVLGASHTDPDFVVQGNGFVFARKYTTTLASIPDYVFESDYDLMPLSDLRKYIKTNHHLPNIPSAAEYEETGVDLGELNRLLLEKVEELTLYTLQLEERLRKLEEGK